MRKLEPDLAIVDLAMGESDGPLFIRDLVSRGPRTRVLVYSVGDELVYGERVLRAGAHGYLMKTRPMEDVLTAARYVLAGNTYVSDEFGGLLLGKRFSQTASTPQAHAVLEYLTDRELQVLRYIGLGHSTGKIARELHLSPKTVGAHREKLKNKLSIESAAELVQRAVTLVMDGVI